MTNTYLLEVIQALRPAEQQEMVLYLASPLFNKGGNAQEVAKLYQLIMAAAPDFPAHLVQKDIIYAQMFPAQANVQGKLEKLMADLNKMVRNYALTNRYLSENMEEERQIDWAGWLRERGLPERSRQVIHKLKTQNERVEKESLKRYQSNLLIAEEEHEWESTQNQFKGDLQIPNLIYHLELYCQNYRTELANRYLLQQKGAQLPDLIWASSNNDFWLEESALLQISKSINQIFSKNLPTQSEFQNLMQLLHSHQEVLSFQTLAQFNAYLRNSCTLLINSGHLEFIHILHEIHKDNLSRGYLFINGEISPNAYMNLVQTALRAKAIVWAKDFSEEYRLKIIGGDEGQFFYNFNLVHCLFTESKFDEALVQLPDIPSGSQLHHMVRRLELKIYYELDSDLLLYKIDAFRKYIERTAPKTISANLRELDINFLNILLQLTQSPAKDKARSAKLIKRIEEKKLLADRAWLMEKARELG